MTMIVSELPCYLWVKVEIEIKREWRYGDPARNGYKERKKEKADENKKVIYTVELCRTNRP